MASPRVRSRSRSSSDGSDHSVAWKARCLAELRAERAAEDAETDNEGNQPVYGSYVGGVSTQSFHTDIEQAEQATAEAFAALACRNFEAAWDIACRVDARNAPRILPLMAALAFRRVSLLPLEPLPVGANLEEWANRLEQRNQTGGDIPVLKHRTDQWHHEGEPKGPIATMFVEAADAGHAFFVDYVAGAINKYGGKQPPLRTRDPMQGSEGSGLSSAEAVSSLCARWRDENMQTFPPLLYMSFLLCPLVPYQSIGIKEISASNHLLQEGIARFRHGNYNECYHYLAAAAEEGHRAAYPYLAVLIYRRVKGLKLYRLMTVYPGKGDVATKRRAAQYMGEAAIDGHAFFLPYLSKVLARFGYDAEKELDVARRYRNVTGLQRVLLHKWGRDGGWTALPQTLADMLLGVER